MWRVRGVPLELQAHFGAEVLCERQQSARFRRSHCFVFSVFGAMGTRTLRNQKNWSGRAETFPAWRLALRNSYPYTKIRTASGQAIMAKCTCNFLAFLLLAPKLMRSRKLDFKCLGGWLRFDPVFRRGGGRSGTLPDACSGFTRKPVLLPPRAAAPRHVILSVAAPASA
jgi:hypothetical protein